MALRVDGSLLAVGDDGAVVYNSDGALVQTLPGIFDQFDSSIIITDVATDGENNFYVLPTFDQTIYKFDANGRFLDRIGQEGEQPGDLDSANSIAVDGQGRIFVEDFVGNLLYEANGRYQETLAMEGAAFTLLFDSQNQLLRMNRNGNQIERYILTR